MKEEVKGNPFSVNTVDVNNWVIDGKTIEESVKMVVARSVCCGFWGKEIILWWDSHCLTKMMQNVGPNLSYFGFTNRVPNGISIFEGVVAVKVVDTEKKVMSRLTYSVDGVLRGRLRSPTDEEWQAIREGRTPFDPQGMAPYPL